MAKKNSATSRRKSPAKARRNVLLAPHFDVSLDGNTDTNFYTGFEGTIASGGLFIATYDVHPPGTSLSVNARLPNGRVLKKKAIVEWVRGYSDQSTDLHPGMGVVFEQIGADDEQDIHGFMLDRDSIFYEAV